MEFSRQEYWSGVPLPFPYKVNKMPKYSDSNLTEVLTGSRGFPGGSAGKESSCNVGDLGLIPGLGRSPREGNSYPLQYSGLENSVHGVHGVAKRRT